MKNILTVKNMAVIAILGVLSAILMMLDFPIAIAPAFYKLDLSDLPCLIGGFTLGPIPALFIELIKIIVKLLIKPTSTAFVGELAAFIISSSFVFTAALIYKNNKTRSSALKAMVIGTIVMAIVGTIANYLFIIPFYVKMYNMPLETIIGMGQAIFPIIKDKLSFVLCCVLPFNIIKGTIVSIVTLILYKRISVIIK